MQKKNNIYSFESFSQFPDLIHGFSTRSIGDMRPSHGESEVGRVKFSDVLEINSAQIVRMNQVHSSHVAQVETFDVGSEIGNTDGLVTATRNVFLSVVTGDCVPVLFFDRYKKICGVVHAGWRGLLDEIITEAIEQMKEMGSNPVDIFAGIGPCIRSCHYDIDQKRVDLFTHKFSQKHSMPLGYIADYQGKTYLNMPYLAKKQLIESGVLEEHIEDSGLCTFESPDLYSYRRDGESFGEVMGIIGRR